ncbi:ATP-dependent nuclease [Oceanibaculum nanhaiense]|uniref:AAA family ATPase n=1 Tax=Oceanibaculum nanhaiense TaxID=1909734 RepID=UPI003D296ED6
MKLKTAYARFYKSFNFDQARKLNGTERQPWELFRDKFFPYVTVEIDPKITTIVGANESGKSHLLGVIKGAITGKDIRHRDHCRYSPFFGVAKGQGCWPHVGVGWDSVTPEEAAAIQALTDAPTADFDRFLMFREEPDCITAWFRDNDDKFVKRELKAEATQQLQRLVPCPFEIDSTVALPNSIPFAFLADQGSAPSATLSRSAMEQLIKALASVRPLLDSGAAAVQKNPDAIIKALSPLARPIESQLSRTELKSLQLGRSLLLTLGEIDEDSLIEIANGIDEKEDGYVAGLLQSTNKQLEQKLNFKRYWVQDRDFSLKVSTRDREITFMISDRTGSVYTFSERSSGLRFFLSYLIQAQIHHPSQEQESILLMDEPDTFLSAEAQQDLMRVFSDLADPAPGIDPLQVVYVTHSPFLLDKNHGERIRVLEKGTGLEGTRVVPRATRNHYEPLRSAFGPFAGESAFVGSVNLVVEGPSDRILLAGAASLTREHFSGLQDDTLDLNRMVIVPGGSAKEIAYAVFGIRGRGADKPPVVILLDADKAGLAAKEEFRTDKRLRNLIDFENILDLSSIGEGVDAWPQTPEMEDLLPVPLAHQALQLVIADIVKFREGKPPEITLDAIEKETSRGGHLIDAIDRVFKKTGGKVDKVAFAKSVIEVCRAADKAMAPHIDVFLQRMRLIFRAVNAAVRNATDETANKRLEKLIEERLGLFKIDYPHHATREQARILLGQIERQLDESPEADAIRNAIVPIRRTFNLEQDLAELVGDYDGFLECLEGLKRTWLNAQSVTTKAAEQQSNGETPPSAPQAGAPRRRRGAKAGHNAHEAQKSTNPI